MIGFILGMFIGGAVGFLTAGLLASGSRYEDRRTWDESISNFDDRE